MSFSWARWTLLDWNALVSHHFSKRQADPTKIKPWPLRIGSYVICALTQIFALLRQFLKNQDLAYYLISLMFVIMVLSIKKSLLIFAEAFLHELAKITFRWTFQASIRKNQPKPSFEKVVSWLFFFLWPFVCQFWAEVNSVSRMKFILLSWAKSSSSRSVDLVLFFVKVKPLCVLFAFE